MTTRFAGQLATPPDPATSGDWIAAARWPPFKQSSAAECGAQVGHVSVEHAAGGCEVAIGRGHLAALTAADAYGWSM